jgi:L-alanine-DL-glutamate epimerase-like enolase superfamily enzyme
MLLDHKSGRRRFRRIAWGQTSYPLIKPYDLSFVRLFAYESVWVCIEDEAGTIGLGEAVALPGYGWETTESIVVVVRRMLENAAALSEAELVQRAAVEREQHPFAASAVMTALELPAYLDGGHTKRFPLNGPVSAEEPELQFRKDVACQLGNGFPYIKVKVGASFDTNIPAARAILTEFPESRFQAVFDANQGFSLVDALRFARELAECASPRLLWFEQPVHRDDWTSMERICREATVPILLDECIYDEADIARAAAIGAYGIKLKLFKNFGISETLALARIAQSKGLVVVFGNGVATDIGNLGEYLTLENADGLFTFPAECNGFVKLAAPVFPDLLGVDADGNITCRADDGAVRRALAKFNQGIPNQ